MPDDEVLRWAAETVLGWTQTPACGYQEALGGWLGFGLAVEAARDEALRIAFGDSSSDQWWVTLDCGEEPLGVAHNADPGIAAWLALREAVS